MGGGLQYFYNAAGNLVETLSLDDLDSPTETIAVEMEYDDYGRKTRSIDPDKGDWRYEYNAFGELIEQRDAKLQVTTMTYDELGRMRARSGHAVGGQAVEISTWAYDIGILGEQRPGLLTGSSHISEEVSGTEISNEGKYYIFDSRGRGTGVGVVLVVDGVSKTYNEGMSYDEHGRVFQQFAMTGDGRGTQNVYNSRGYLQKVKESYYDNNTVQVTYLENKKMDALGNVTEHKVGNRTVERSYDQASNRLMSIYSRDGTDVSTVDYLVMTYDVFGNLESRRHLSGPLFSATVDAKESYCYDDLHRLTKEYSDRLDGDCDGSGSPDVEYEYSALGNIEEKNGRTYHYGAGSAGPHAVTSVQETGQNTITYAYDANGNMLSGDEDDRDFTYSVFDQMTKVERGTSNTLEFGYGVDRQRNYREEKIGTDITKTFYMGSAERVELPTGSVEIRRRIGGNVVITHSLNSSDEVQTKKVRYQVLDHLGSPIAVYDNTAAPTERLSFGSWGGRRDYDTLLDLAQYTDIGGDTVRSYTGHEDGDAFGIIHMNGRIYDPHLGRMLQADPFIDGVTNTQGYNRYSYVANNPLTYADPSGYFKWKQLTGLAVAAVGAWICGPHCATVGWEVFAVGAASGGAQAAANGGNITQGAVFGGISANAFVAIGNGFNAAGAENLKFGPPAPDLIQFGGNYLTASQVAGQIGLHGLTGGVLAEMQGGDFIQGFVSAGFTKAALGSGPGMAVAEGSFAGRVAVYAIVGGTASSLTGGKFANGATTAAFQVLFNEMAQARLRTPSNDRSRVVPRRPFEEQADIFVGAAVAGGSATICYLTLCTGNALALTVGGVVLSVDQITTITDGSSLITTALEAGGLSPEAAVGVRDAAGGALNLVHPVQRGAGALRSIATYGTIPMTGLDKASDFSWAISSSVYLESLSD